MKSGVVILGIYAADLSFRAARQPHMGETLIGTAFAMGPGGKGSNQSVAAARAERRTGSVIASACAAVTAG